MDIILLEHIDELGTVGQTVKVKDGYARNYLIPKKLACPATEQNLNFYRTLIESRQKKLAKEKASAETQAQKLSSVTLTFFRKSRDQESRLFGSVTGADISHALAEKGFEFDKRRISLSEPLKTFGEFKIDIRLHPEVKAAVNVIVKPEGETEDAG
ncbi:MAG TPA: 50S ribosomal protein L9 [Desulfomonilaceae bacterium]|nr:50S ribosomal protein L9 [Desulfomonilaceae bacterium]